LHISLYPNPTKQKLYLEIISGKEFKASLSMINMLGQQVLIKDITLHNGFEKLDVDISAFAAGVYEVILQTDKKFFSDRFVKED
jgi:hypothetical protein